MPKPHPAFDEQDDIVLSKIDKLNTKRCTESALRKWQAWKAEKNAEAGENIPSLIELMTMSDKEIDKFLAMFIKDLKRGNGENYPGNSARYYLFGIQRYSKAYATINDQHSIDRIDLSGRNAAFPKFNAALKDKLKLLRKVKMSSTHTPSKQKGLSFSQIKEAALWDKNILGCHTADAISNTICVYVMKIFGIATGAALRNMYFEHFIFSEDEHGKYVELDLSLVETEDTEQIFNRCFGIRVQETGRLRQYCDPSNERSFYNILQNYVARTSSIREYFQREGKPTPLFLIPQKVKTGDNSSSDFTAKPIGKNNMQTKFSKIMREGRYSSGTYNNQGLVVSIYPQLLAKGYDTRTHKFFKPSDHLEICKILDPPPGPLRVTENEPTIVHMTRLYDHGLDQVSSSALTTVGNQTSVPAFINLRLVQVSEAGNQNSTSQQSSPIPVCIHMNASQCKPIKIAPAPEKVVQPVRQPEEVVQPTRQYVVMPARQFLPRASKSQKSVGSPTEEAEYLRVPTIVSRAETRRMQHFTTREEEPHRIQDLTSSETIANLRKKITSRALAASSTETMETVQHRIKPEKDQEPLLPLFLESTKGDPQSCQQTDNSPPNIIIKCEAVDEFEESEVQSTVAQTDTSNNAAQPVHKKITCHNNNNDTAQAMHQVIADNEGYNMVQAEPQTIPHNDNRNISATNQRKRSIPEFDGDNTETGLYNNKRAKASMVNRKCDESETPTSFMTNGNSDQTANTTDDQTVMYPNIYSGAETKTHMAKVEYSFSNDLNRSSVRQEVRVNDDDHDLFSFSATNKMGKTLSDLDLNLGDYLPDDCLLKPSNINLKRVVTPEGGKLVIQVKYESRY